MSIGPFGVEVTKAFTLPSGTKAKQVKNQMKLVGDWKTTGRPAVKNAQHLNSKKFMDPIPVNRFKRTS